MTRKKKQDSKEDNRPEDIKKLDVRVDDFGNLHHTVKIEDLNSFLDEEVDDKKFRGVDVERKEKSEKKKPKKK